MSAVLVYELNHKQCEHGVGRGFSCDDCAQKRGTKLVEKMSELSKRLHKASDDYTNSEHALCAEAAEQIEELEAENKRLRRALKQVARHYGSAEQCREFAQVALKGNDDE